MAGEVEAASEEEESTRSWEAVTSAMATSGDVAVAVAAAAMVIRVAV